jgi:hypothetical protein
MKKRDEVLHTGADSRTLYVVLQGEFAMFRAPSGNDYDDDTLVVQAPYVEWHTYLAGPWLTNWRDTPEVPKAMSLENAFGDRKRSGKHSPRSTPEKNIDIVPNLGTLQIQRSAQLAERGARLQITAPMPLAIIPGLMQTTGGVIIQETDDNHDTTYVAPPPSPTVTPILVYKWFPDIGVPCLSGDGCQEPIYSGPRDSQFQSLHIYATAPDRVYEERFAVPAFTAAAALLGIQATLISDPDEPSQSIYATPPAGLSFAQVNWFLYNIWDLDPTDSRLIADDDPGPAPHDDGLVLTGDRLVLAGGPHNCGSVTGG